MKQHPDGDETLPVSEKREIDTERGRQREDMKK